MHYPMHFPHQWERWRRGIGHTGPYPVISTPSMVQVSPWSLVEIVHT